MILIADSGSTKTDWCVVENGQPIQQISTKGINPFFQSEEEISNEIATSLLPQLKTNALDAVYFYGAGCGFPDKIAMVQGKLLVGDILKNQMTPELKEKFLKQFGLTPADIIDRVYRKPFPNRFLASLSPFLAQNIDEPCIHALVLGSFKSFLKRNVMQYENFRNSKVHFIGSVAFYYKTILAEAAQEMNIQLGTIIKSPMEGLIKYHSGK